MRDTFDLGWLSKIVLLKNIFLVGEKSYAKQGTVTYCQLLNEAVHCVVGNKLSIIGVVREGSGGGLLQRNCQDIAHP